MEASYGRVLMVTTIGVVGEAWREHADRESDLWIGGDPRTRPCG